MKKTSLEYFYFKTVKITVKILSEQHDIHLIVSNMSCFIFLGGLPLASIFRQGQKPVSSVGTRSGVGLKRESYSWWGLLNSKNGVRIMICDILIVSMSSISRFFNHYSPMGRILRYRWKFITHAAKCPLFYWPQESRSTT